jgi:hypothetical protein
MGDEAESSSPHPRAQALADASAGRDPIGPSGLSWTDADWNTYFKSYWKERHGMAPARAPVAWPVALVLIAADAAVWAAFVRSSWRERPLLFACQWGLGRLTERAERRRARYLGLQSAAEQPRALARITVPPLGRTAPVSVQLPARAFVPSMMVALAIGLVRRLRDRWPGPRAREVPQRWELYLATQLSGEILRRRDWRRAGGPTRPRS